MTQAADLPATVTHPLPSCVKWWLEKFILLQVRRHLDLRLFNVHHRAVPATYDHGEIAKGERLRFEFLAAASGCWLLAARSSEDQTLWGCPELRTISSGCGIPPFTSPWKGARCVLQRTELPLPRPSAAKQAAR